MPCIHELIRCEWCHGSNADPGAATAAMQRRNLDSLQSAYELANRPQVSARIVPVPTTSVLPVTSSRWLPRNPYPRHAVVTGR